MKTLFSTLFFVALTLLAIDLKAEIQYNVQSNTGEAYFTVDTPSTVYVSVSHRYNGRSFELGDSVITNIGYYYYDDLKTYVKMSGDLTGGPSNPNKFGTSGESSNLQALRHYGDMETGALGEFKPEDKIVLWVETTSADGKTTSTFTSYAIPASSNAKNLWMLSESGENIVFNWGDFVAGSPKSVDTGDFLFSITTNAPNGQPLPGIIATLLIGGGGGLLYLKKRKKRSADK